MSSKADALSCFRRNFRNVKAAESGGFHIVAIRVLALRVGRASSSWRPPELSRSPSRSL